MHGKHPPRCLHLRGLLVLCILLVKDRWEFIFFVLFGVFSSFIRLIYLYLEVGEALSATPPFMIANGFIALVLCIELLVSSVIKIVIVLRYSRSPFLLMIAWEVLLKENRLFRYYLTAFLFCVFVMFFVEFSVGLFFL